MINDQLTKMKENTPARYCLLPWTLVPNGLYVTFVLPTIIDLAQAANKGAVTTAVEINKMLHGYGL